MSPPPSYQRIQRHPGTKRRNCTKSPDRPHLGNHSLGVLSYRKLDQVKGESQRFLVVELRDKGPKGDFLGFVEINLNNIADIIQREEWFELQKKKKKDKVTGEILLRTCIRPEVRQSRYAPLENLVFTFPSTEKSRRNDCDARRKLPHHSFIYL